MVNSSKRLLQVRAALSREYLGTSSPADRLPYGLSAESFTVRALREADKAAKSAQEREHVTPWIRHHYGGTPFRPSGIKDDLSHLRCTIDTLEDYRNITEVFHGIAEPVAVGWRELCQRLEAAAPKPRFPAPLRGSLHICEMTLGTAQLGMPNYGRANITGRPDEASAIALVSEALRRGVDSIDTARAYGEAEHVIGKSVRAFGDVRVITKLDPTVELAASASRAQVRQTVDASVFRSCRELGLSRLSVLLLHRWHQRHNHAEAIWERLLELRAEGVINELGASVSTPEEAHAALAEEQITHLQLPFNLLDHRWHAAGVPEAARGQPEVTVHARSVLLQGILPAAAEVWPRVPVVTSHEVVSLLEGLCQHFGLPTRLDLALAYARSQRWINSLVVGVERREQLLDLVERFQRPALSETEAEQLRRRLPTLPEGFLNPGLWPAVPSYHEQAV